MSHENPCRYRPTQGCSCVIELIGECVLNHSQELGSDSIFIVLLQGWHQRRKGEDDRADRAELTVYSTGRVGPTCNEQNEKGNTLGRSSCRVPRVFPLSFRLVAASFSRCLRTRSYVDPSLLSAASISACPISCRCCGYRARADAEGGAHPRTVSETSAPRRSASW